MNRHVKVLFVIAVLLFMVGSWGRSTSATSTTPEATMSATQAPAATEAATAEGTGGPLTPVTLFLGYIPDIQFAPVYVAVDKGYFKDAGIDIKLEHSFDETDGLNRIGTNKLQFGLISGEEVILARASDAPVTYVFRWYQSFPIGIAVPADSDIKEPKQLAGHIVGLPGKYGASYVGLQALLNAVGLKESDLKQVKETGFDITPFCNKQVEASVVYVANEPAQIEKQCFKVNVFKISDYANIVSNGLVTNETTLKNQPDLVRGMNAALARGLTDTLADPKAAYDISRKYVDTLAADDPVQMAVLTNSLDLWKTDKPGYSDPAAWKLTLDTLKAMGLVTKDIDLTTVYSNDYLPQQPQPTQQPTQ